MYSSTVGLSRRVVGLIAVFLIIGTFTWAGGTKEGTTAAVGEMPRNESIIIGESHNFRGMDPAQMISSQESSLANTIYEGLTAYNKDNPGQPLPALAESWTVSPDAKEWVFHIRKGVKFTTGKEMTAEDVVYSLKRGMEIDAPTYPPLKRFIKSADIQVVDKYTVKMNLYNGFAGWADMVSLTHCGILDKDALQKHITTADPMGVAFLNDTSIGTGPMYLKEWKRNERVVLQKNPTYWGIAAGYHRVPSYNYFIDLNVPEPVTQQLMLINGDMDLSKELAKDIIDQMRDKPSVRVDQYKRFIGSSYLMNLQYPPFKDVKVRQAIKYAIDYDTLDNQIMSAIRMDRPIMKPAIGTDDKLIYSYDLAKAKKLMAESSYPNGFEVVHCIGTGVGLGADWESIGLKLQSDLAKIGIKVTLEQYEWSTMDEKLLSGNYQSQQNWFGVFYGDTEGHLSMFGRPSSHHVSITGWKNDKIEALADKAMTATVPEERYKLYRELSEEFAVDGPEAFIGQEIGLNVFSKNVSGFDGNPNAFEFDYAVLHRE